MTTLLTITAKGQVTLRRDVLEHLGVAPGEKIEVTKLPDGHLEIRAARVKGNINDFIRCLADQPGPVLTIEEMNEP